MKIKNVEGWPEGSLHSIGRTKFEILTDKEYNTENILEYYDSEYKNANNDTGVILIANYKTIKRLDRQIPTTFTTYRKYIKDTGLVDIIIEENEGLVKEGEAHLLFFFYKNQSCKEKANEDEI